MDIQLKVLASPICLSLGTFHSKDLVSVAPSESEKHPCGASYVKYLPGLIFRIKQLDLLNPLAVNIRPVNSFNTHSF